MTSIVLPCAPPRSVSFIDRVLLASSAALVALVQRRHDVALIRRVECAVDARRDAAAARHLGMLPR